MTKSKNIYTLEMFSTVRSYTVRFVNMVNLSFPKNIRFQVLAAVAVSMGSMIVGFSSAYTSPALASMEDSDIIQVSEEQVLIAK